MKETSMVRVISGEDVKEILAGKEKQVIYIVEEAFKKRLKGSVMLPDKISQIFDSKIQKRINCMPASILDEKVSGVKWISVFPQNPNEGYRNVTGQILLSELEHGYPIAFMDGTYLTALRTATVGAIASKYLGKKECVELGFIGAGEQARMHFQIIKLIHPEIRVCKVSSRSQSTITLFIKELRKIYPDVTYVNCGTDYQEAVCDADIIVTAISAQTDLLKAAWIKKGTLYIHVGGWEDEFAVARRADKIVCDEWESVKHRAQTISRMYAAGELKDEDIYCNLGEIITGQKKGRLNNEEFIYFNSVGVGFVDIYLAYRVYQMALESERGMSIEL